MQVTSLSNLCIACWLVGRLPEAFAYGRRALEYADQLLHAHTLGYAYAHVCMLYTLERDVGTVQALAQRALAGAIERGLPLWISVARSFLGWSEVESGSLAEGIDTPRRASKGKWAASRRGAPYMCTRTSWRKQGFVLSRHAMSLGGAVTTGTRLSTFASKGGFPRTFKSMMRRSLNGTSSKRLRSPAGVASADLPCARRTVLPGFSLPKARTNVHTHCCNTN